MNARILALLPALAACRPAPSALEALRDAALRGSRAAEIARSLTDEVGPRLAGSPGDARAVAWALATLKRLGLANVRAERVSVRRWVRVSESGEITEPYPQRLILTALGGSEATPAGGLEAPVVEVGSLEALDALVSGGTPVRGKIVFVNARMRRARDWAEYSRIARVRLFGASRAARHGAVALLMRSAGTSPARIAHTGAVLYDPAQPRIPAAALSNPDADLLSRLVRTGRPVRVRLSLQTADGGEVPSANVLGEVVGRERPSEIVLLGAHLDSWDLGTGAVDDAAGCAIVLEAARRIAELPGRPRRTVRVVLFAGEERGLWGAKAYARDHALELSRHVAAIEADAGTGAPLGFTWHAGAGAEPVLRELVAPLRAIGADRLEASASAGADIGKLRPAGVPLFGLLQDITRYFDYHHSADDTFDKIEPRSLDRAVAAVAVLAWGLAEMPEPLPRAPAK